MKDARHSFVLAVVKTWWLWPIVAVVVTYALIMLLSAGQSVWFDEGYSILLAKRPVAELVALTGVDAHPPFYYLLLKAWAGVFGWSEFALRSLSAVAASLTVGVVFLLVRKLFTVRTALVALLFLVIAPFALRYGYEIRMYAVVALIAAVASLVLLYARQGNKKAPWIVYAGLVALGMFTLYMSAAIWLAHLVWLLFTTKSEKRRSFRSFVMQPWVLSFAGAVVLFAAYIPTLFYQLTHSALPGIGDAVTLTRLADIFGLLFSFTPQWGLTGILSLAILAVLVMAISLLVFVRAKLPKEQRQYLWFAIALVGVPLLFFALTSLPKPIFVSRYMAHVAIFVYMLLGITIALGWRYGKRMTAGWLAAISLVLLALGVLQLHQTGNFVFERLQRPQTIEVRNAMTCDSETTVVAEDPYTYIDSAYYFDGCDLRFVSADPVQKQGGYAPLFDSTKRIVTSGDVSSVNLIHLHWEGVPAFSVDERYEFMGSETHDKQVIDFYKLR